MRRGAARSSAGGVATDATISSITDSGRTRRTHNSVRSTSRCASAGTATAFTSSGLTKSRPASAACAWASFITARLPRGLAPTSTLALSTCRAHDVDDIAPDALGDVHGFQRVLHRDERCRRDDGFERDVVGAARDALLEHRPFGPGVGITDTGSEQEAIELRFGQRIGPLVLDRVLRGDHEERRGERVRDAVGGHLPFLHRLEQRGLGLRWGAVDLVTEHEVGEQGSGAELELARLLIEDRRAGHVGRHEVGGELHAREIHADRRRANERAMRVLASPGLSSTST